MGPNLSEQQKKVWGFTIHILIGLLGKHGRKDLAAAAAASTFVLSEFEMGPLADLSCCLPLPLSLSRLVPSLIDYSLAKFHQQSSLQIHLGTQQKVSTHSKGNQIHQHQLSIADVNLEP
jgi:hypothetical protein